MEKLAVDNPDEFLERLNQLERRRIEERSTLRHKNSTKWAKEKRLLAKFNTKVKRRRNFVFNAKTFRFFDEKVREDIEEQLKIGKKLSSKQAEVDSDDDDDDDDETKEIVEETKKKPTEIPLILAPSHQEAEANPWLTTTGSVVLPASEYSKPMEVQKSDESSSSSESEAEEEEKTTKPSQTEGLKKEKPKKDEHLEMPKTTKPIEIKEINDQHQMNIQEAFADDDVLAEFEKEKVKLEFETKKNIKIFLISVVFQTDLIERDRPKPIDLSLPGWGDWAGSGVPENKRKKRK